MLKANIDNTFHESLPVVFAWSIFDPLKVPNKEHLSFKTHMYSKNQVHPLVKHFMSSMPPDKKQSVGDAIKPEFAKLKYDMLTWKEEIPKECYPSDVPYKVTATEWNLQQICKLYYFYLQLSNVADLMLSTPVSNAWPERGTSCMKWVKTRFRSKLHNDMLHVARPWHRCCQIANRRSSEDLDSCKV